jgi:hypothetical protein
LSEWAAGDTGDDLNLNTNVLVDMSQPPFTTALARFQKLVVFGNLKGDSLVGPATSLISTELHNINSLSTPLELASTGSVKVHLHESTEKCDAPCEAFLDVISFQKVEHVLRKSLGLSETKYNKVLQMFQGLSSLPWIRYPITISDGNAHIRIICHNPKDELQVGRPVVQKILSIFIESGSDSPKPADSEKAVSS